MRKIVSSLHVRAISQRAITGILVCGGLRVPCSLGRTGTKVMKREGDGASPAGRWMLRTAWHRADRGVRLNGAVPAKPIRSDFGWCDGAGDRNYNRPVRLPYAASHEEMARADHLYDIVVTLSHNERPRIQGHGSAVFFHLRSADGGPTAGCIAVSARDMKIVLAHCGPRTRLVIWPVTA